LQSTKTNGHVGNGVCYINQDRLKDTPEEQRNGVVAQNGTAKLLQNGCSNKAADYYVKGDIPSDLTQRKVHQQ
jgi:hypothetical protein